MNRIHRRPEIDVAPVPVEVVVTGFRPSLDDVFRLTVLFLVSQSILVAIVALILYLAGVVAP